MAKLSERYNVLKKFNRRASKERNIRVGSVVTTKRGIGIVVHRKGASLEIAHKPDKVGESLWCYRYIYDISDVSLSDEVTDKSTKLYRGAWQWILDGAIQENQTYEVRKHQAIFEDRESNIPGKRMDRDVSMGDWGSTKYRRYTGVNRNGQPFDFELNVMKPFIPYGDRVLYAIGASDGYITDMNGHGRIYRRKITDADVNYGLAKYAGPQKEGDQ